MVQYTLILNVEEHSIFLNPLELAQFAKAGKWFIQHHNCDFGPEINQMCMGVK